MTKKKKPTIKELVDIINNQSRAIKMQDAGLKGMSNVLKEYIEFKGDLIEFNARLAEKQREYEAKIRAEEQEDAEAVAKENDDRNTD